jgi:radical S-adenosyl methionine domain-containing protein 2
MNAFHPCNAQPIVINWHVTEACNYRCGYCYAKWERPSRADLIRDLGAAQALLESLYSHFGTGVAKPRINFAGGEPLLLGERLVTTIELARTIGFDVSLISNGSLLSERRVSQLAPHLSLLGLSIDSVRPEVLAAIGRQSRSSCQVDFATLVQLVARARRINPLLNLKINTVVCAANWKDDLADAIRDLSPRRWKLLRMLPVVSHELEVTAAQFSAFVERHRSLADVMSVEDAEDMTESYIMVDPSGRFFQNRKETSGYDYSPPIIEVGAKEAFASIGWSAVKFQARYPHTEVAG